MKDNTPEYIGQRLSELDSNNNRRSFIAVSCKYCRKLFWVYTFKKSKYCLPCFRRKPKHKTPIKIRFWRHVKKSNDCWIWDGAKDVHGYGIITEEKLKGRKRHRAHRVSWEIHNGIIPEGLFVLHRCDTPICVNPKHLFIGTQLDNMKDCFNKNRSPKGIKNGHARLSEKNVLDIRKEYANNPISMEKISKKYGVSYSTIQCLISKRSWSHI